MLNNLSFERKRIRTNVRCDVGSKKIGLMSRTNSLAQAVTPAGFVTKEGKVENHQIILSQRRHRTPLIFDEENLFQSDR
jgi:hypothetical protein